MSLVHHVANTLSYGDVAHALLRAASRLVSTLGGAEKQRGRIDEMPYLVVKGLGA